MRRLGICQFRNRRSGTAGTTRKVIRGMDKTKQAQQSTRGGEEGKEEGNTGERGERRRRRKREKRRALFRLLFLGEGCGGTLASSSPLCRGEVRMDPDQGGEQEGCRVVLRLLFLGDEDEGSLASFLLLSWR